MQIMGLFSVLIEETIRRLLVMMQVMGLFSVLIEDTIMRFQVFRVLIKDTEF